MSKTPTPEQLEEVARAIDEIMWKMASETGEQYRRRQARAAWDAVVKAMDKEVRKWGDGHAHKWTTIQEIKMFSEWNTTMPCGTDFILKCEICGTFKRKRCRS